MIFDTHTHYDDEAYNEDRNAVIEQVHKDGVGYMINVGAELKGSEASIALAEKYDYIFAAVGAHPYDAASIDDEYIGKLRELSCHEKVVAIGEIGLDYHENSDREVQITAFKKQMDLAVEVGLPVIIHDRDAHGDVLEVLQEYAAKSPSLTGVVHCFSGSQEFAKEVLRLGYYIAFGGVVTFKNAKKAVEAAAIIDEDKLLIETDCPYLSPTPFRGERNHSGRLNFVVNKLAEIRGTTAQEIERITSDNAKRLFLK